MQLIKALLVVVLLSSILLFDSGIDYHYSDLGGFRPSIEPISHKNDVYALIDRSSDTISMQAIYNVRLNRKTKQLIYTNLETHQVDSTPRVVSELRLLKAYK